MTRVTDDPTDPDVRRGAPRHGAHSSARHLLGTLGRGTSEWVCAPVRNSYRHVGITGPAFETRPLTIDEVERFKGLSVPYVSYEPYPDGYQVGCEGRYWTQDQLDKVGKGCNTVTAMGPELSETYARQPGFYGSTYCVGCSMHLAVGIDGEFVWDDGTDERVGT